MEQTQNLSSPTWVKGSFIGKGSFATVNLAINKSKNQVFAVKSVDVNSSPSSHVEALENEIQILRKLSSPYIIKYLDDDLLGASRNLHIEYMPGGSLVACADERITRSYTKCVASALHYMHSQGLVHCDVKGKNVLIGSIPGVAKLADFGSTKRISSYRKTVQGTPLWMAPEVIRQESQGPESDVWSLGCTVIEMVTGKPAWDFCDVNMVFKIGFSDDVPKFPAQLSELGRDFLDKCLRRDANERWTCEQLLRHPFVCDSLDLGGVESSPRSVLNWANSEQVQNSFDTHSCNSSFSSQNYVNLVKDRIGKLACNGRVLWESDGWEVVRSSSGEEEAEEKMVGISLEYSVESGGVNLDFLCCGCRCCSCCCCCCCCWIAGLGCRYGLKKNREFEVEGSHKGCYSCCKLFFLLVFNHILMLCRFVLIILSSSKEHTRIVVFLGLRKRKNKNNSLNWVSFLGDHG